MTVGISHSDEQALLSLVQGVEGQRWSASIRGWSLDSDTPVCEWEGVACRISLEGGPPAVAELILPAKGLEGSIPSELGLLSDLERLNLNGNSLVGSIPAEVAGLAKLATLDLTGCFLTGTLPQRFESPRLTNLLLANNAISGRFFETSHSPHLASIQVSFS